jgi:drug/metabolite transporter (DMT)-like permease
MSSFVKANLLLFISSIAFGSSFIATKIALEVYNPYIVAAGRLFIGCVAFLIFFGELKKVKIRPSDWKILIFIGLFEPFLCFIFENNALQLTSASQAGIVTAILPLMVGCAAWFFLSETFSLQKGVGFLVAFLGVVWLTLSAQLTESSPNPMLGNFLELLAMLCATVSIIAIKRLCQRYSWIFLTATQIFISSILFVPVILFNPQTYNLVFDSSAVLALLYLGLFINIMAYGFYNYGISKIPAGQASVYVNLIPVFAMFFGFIILKETLTVANGLASLVVFTGVFISQTDGMQVNLSGPDFLQKIFAKRYIP